MKAHINLSRAWTDFVVSTYFEVRDSDNLFLTSNTYYLSETTCFLN